MKYWQLTILILLACLGCTDEQSTKKRASDPRPNIIFIISDDLGYGSVGAYGGTRFETPNLDYWVANGMRFTNFYVASPICSPSRANILTGRTPREAGLREVLRPTAGAAVKGMETALPTFAEVIGQNGYNTALIGKWHLGYREEEHPLNRGFDYFKGFLGGAVNYLSHEYTSGGHALSEGFESWEPSKGKHLSKIFTDEAISYIEEKRQQPYLLVLTYANPHRPFILPGEDDIEEQDPKVKLFTPKRYKKMVRLLDRHLGKIHESVAEQNQNTIIIFISDHGCNGTMLANKPLRGGKGDLFEGGIKVPAIAYWPSKTKQTEITDVVSTYDLFPSLLQLSGTAINDSLSLTGHPLIDATGTYQAPPQRPLFWLHEAVHVVRDGSWKAMFITAKIQHIVDDYLSKEEQEELSHLTETYDGYIPLLYNLEDDPIEAHNLSLTAPEEMNNLWQLFLQHQSEKNDL